jgi:hypothetical protein
MEEIATKLEFPAYFGKNIPALSECLQDLEWLPGSAYLLILYDVTAVLGKETHADLISFFNLLDRIGREWAAGSLPGANWERKRTPFHTGFCGELGEIEKFVRKLQPEINDVPVITVSHAMQAG